MQFEASTYVCFCTNLNDFSLNQALYVGSIQSLTDGTLLLDIMLGSVI